MKWADVSSSLFMVFLMLMHVKFDSCVKGSTWSASSVSFLQNFRALKGDPQLYGDMYKVSSVLFSPPCRPARVYVDQCLVRDAVGLRRTGAEQWTQFQKGTACFVAQLVICRSEATSAAQSCDNREFTKIRDRLQFHYRPHLTLKQTARYT